MIGLKGRNGRYTYVNRAFIETLARPADAILGRVDGDLFDATFAERMAEADHRVMVGADVTQDNVLDLYGRRHHLQTSKALLRGEDGAVAGIVTVARDVTELVEQRQKRERAIRQTVQALVRAIELRDPYLVGHSQRVERICADVARRLDLGDRDRVTLGLAADLSQIGKIFVPAEILRKPGRHTAEETRIMQGHIEHAMRVLREIDFELPVAEVIHGMHERLDGSGYPRGLKGDEIDLLPRILGAVDVFCARTAPRSYRSRIGRDEALRLLADHPERYDARVVEALAAVAAEPEGGTPPADFKRDAEVAAE
jgi:PAS domain S-box-containing protein